MFKKVNSLAEKDALVKEYINQSKKAKDTIEESASGKRFFQIEKEKEFKPLIDASKKESEKLLETIEQQKQVIEDLTGRAGDIQSMSQQQLIELQNQVQLLTDNKTLLQSLDKNTLDQLIQLQKALPLLTSGPTMMAITEKGEKKPKTTFKDFLDQTIQRAIALKKMSSTNYKTFNVRDTVDPDTGFAIGKGNLERNEIDADNISVNVKGQPRSFQLTEGLVYLLFYPGSFIIPELEAKITQDDMNNYARILKLAKYNFSKASDKVKNLKADKAILALSEKDVIDGKGLLESKDVGKRKTRPYNSMKISGDGNLGEVSIDMPKLLNNLTLVVRGKNGDKLMKKEVHPDFVSLLTKRFVASKKYDGGAIDDYRKMWQLSKLPFNNKSAKMKLIFAPKVEEKPEKPEKPEKSKKYIPNSDSDSDDDDESLDESNRMIMLVGEIEAGNNNAKIFHEAFQLAEVLRKKKVLNKKGYQEVISYLESQAKSNYKL